MREKLLDSYRRCKTIGRILRGRDAWFRPDIREPSAYLGSGCGGWSLATRHIPSCPTVYSFGIGEDISFDLAVAEQFGARVFAFDPTPRSIDWLKKQKLPERFWSYRYGLADFDGTIEFHPPEDPACVSHSLLLPPGEEKVHDALALPVKRLSTITQSLGHVNIDILKMDIEGAEYAAIQDLCGTTIRPTQILVEFHHRFTSVGVEQTQEAIHKLREVGYALFSVSSTNEEFSFLYVGGQQRKAA